MGRVSFGAVGGEVQDQPRAGEQLWPRSERRALFHSSFKLHLCMHPGKGTRGGEGDASILCDPDGGTA